MSLSEIRTSSTYRPEAPRDIPEHCANVHSIHALPVQHFDLCSPACKTIVCLDTYTDDPYAPIRSKNLKCTASKQQYHPVPLPWSSPAKTNRRSLQQPMVRPGTSVHARNQHNEQLPKGKAAAESQLRNIRPPLQGFRAKA